MLYSAPIRKIGIKDRKNNTNQLSEQCELINPGEQIQTNGSFWSKKLKRNIERDKEVNQALLEKGWLVLRYWDSDVKKDCSACVKDIMQYLPIPKTEDHDN